MRIINAFYETGFVNPIDEAIRTYRQFDICRVPEAGRSAVRLSSASD